MWLNGWVLKNAELRDSLVKNENGGFTEGADERERERERVNGIQLRIQQYNNAKTIGTKGWLKK